MGMGELLTLAEVQAILKVGRSKVYSLANEPGFPAVRIGHRIRVPRAALERWINEKMTQGA
jgi:excisionase family DNA binding protein